MINPLDELYSAIHNKSCQEIISKKEFVDPHLSLPQNDHRFGITLLIPLGGTLLGGIKNIQDHIAQIDPDQYIYPLPDLHVTVIDLIAANENFNRDILLTDKIINIIKQASLSIAPFILTFKGIIASNTGILAKGYYSRGLHQLRQMVREIAHKENVGLNERYQSISAHTTIMRYKNPIKNRKLLLNYLSKENNARIGSMDVQEMDLVIHDWYNCQKETIEKFILK